MTTFISNPKRDASDAIAGFVYQVDLTILRWLELKADELLELERGEDLDVVQLDGSGALERRTLKQIKRRSSGISLKSADALTAVARFCEHRKANPTIRLRFHFITTGPLAKENEWSLPGSAIQSWESICEGVLNDADQKTALEAIRLFLQRCDSPAGLEDSAWAFLEEIVKEENRSELLELIRSFEWSLGVVDHPELEHRITSELIRRKWATEPAEAQALFEQLFLYVFKRLTQKGLKRLTTSELLAQSQVAPVAKADESFLVFVRELRALTRRVEALEQRSLKGSLTLDYAESIQSFLTEYLGTATHRVPFGGRQSELEGLDRWFFDHSKAPYGLLTAEAGKGKSALLVHWAVSLAERKLARVVFVPISIRFGTSLASVALGALASRLAHIYGEQLPQAPLSAQGWAEVCAGFLRRQPPRGKPVLVILDGLDEATDWNPGPSLFPRPPASGVRCLVSSRYLAGDNDDRGWRRRLGWESRGLAYTVGLPNLTGEGLRALLLSAGDPLEKLARKKDVIQELIRLSEGNCLLLRLYLDELSAEGDRIKSLRSQELGLLKPGFKGYFERWWEDQEQQWKSRYGTGWRLKKDVEDFLSICATALGPLSRDDIAEIAENRLLDSEMKVKIIAGEVGRFVVGDGKEQGYVFSHPRLAAYFHEEMGSRKQTEWEKRFLEYGQKVLRNLNKGNVQPSRAPAYVVRHYGAHLERSGSPARAFYGLVSKGWLRASECVDRSFGAFLTDLKKVQEHAERQMDVRMEIICGLCQSTIISATGHVSTTFVAEAVKRGMLDGRQALRIVFRKRDLMFLLPSIETLMPVLDEASRAHAFETLKEYREFIGLGFVAKIASFLRKDLRESFLNEALESAGHRRRGYFDNGENDRNLSRACDLAALSDYLPEARRASVLRKALSAAEAVHGSGKRAQALAWVGTHLPEVQKETIFREAWWTAKINEGVTEDCWPLKTVAELLPERMLKEAWKDARHLRNKSTAVEIMVLLCNRMPAAGKNAAVREAFLAALSQPEEWKTIDAIRELAAQLSPELAAEAWERLCGTRDSFHREQLLEAVAPRLPDGPLRKEWAAVYERCKAKVPFWRDVKALQLMGPWLPDDLVGEAWQVFLNIEGEFERTSTLEILAPKLPRELIRKAWKIAWRIKDEFSRVQSLEALIPRIPDNLLAETRKAAATFSNREARARILWAVAERLTACKAEVQVEALEAAINATAFIGDDYSLCDALWSLTDHLSGGNKTRFMEEAFRAAEVLGDDLQGSQLEKMASHLPNHLVEGAWAITRAFEQAHERERVAVELIPRLPKRLMPEALQMVENTADEHQRAKMLGVLSPCLPRALVERAWNLALEMKTEAYRAHVFGAIVPRLPRRLIENSLAAARDLQNADFRAPVLELIARQLPRIQQIGVLEEAFRAIGTPTISKKEEFLSTLRRWTGRLPPSSVDAIVKRKAVALNGVLKAVALVSLVLRAPKLQSNDSLNRVLNEARSVEDSYIRASLLTQLIAAVPEDKTQVVLEDAVCATRSVHDIFLLPALLKDLIPNLPTMERDRLVKEAVAEDVIEILHSAKLAEFGPLLPKKIVEEEWQTAKSVDEKMERGQRFVALGPFLPASLVEEALELAPTIYDDYRATLLIALLPNLSGKLLTKAFKITQTLSASERARVLERLAPRLSGRYLEEAFLTDDVIFEREKVLRALTPSLVRWAASEKVNAHAAWSKGLHICADKSRYEFLNWLGSCFPLTIELGGPGTGEVVGNDLLEVTGWWKGDTPQAKKRLDKKQMTHVGRAGKLKPPESKNKGHREQALNEIPLRDMSGYIPF